MILDTDIVIEILRGEPEAKAWFRHIKDEPVISGVAAWEILFGAQNAAELVRIQKFIAKSTVRWPIEEDARLTAKLSKYHLSDGIDILDCLTASIALRHDEAVATFNAKHFRSIPGLSIHVPYDRR